MADIIDVLHRLTFMAHEPAQKLRSAIAEAQTVLDKLDAFAQDAEDGYCLIAASDIMPTHNALIPERSGLTREANA
jgi:hypothetical protein